MATERWPLCHPQQLAAVAAHRSAIFIPYFFLYKKLSGSLSLNPGRLITSDDLMMEVILGAGVPVSSLICTQWLHQPPRYSVSLECIVPKGQSFLSISWPPFWILMSPHRTYCKVQFQSHFSPLSLWLTAVVDLFPGGQT